MFKPPLPPPPGIEFSVIMETPFVLSGSTAKMCHVQYVLFAYSVITPTAVDLEAVKPLVNRMSLSVLETADMFLFEFS